MEQKDRYLNCSKWLCGPIGLQVNLIIVLCIYWITNLEPIFLFVMYIYILSQWNKSHIRKVFSIIYLECPEKFRKIHWAVSASQHNSQGKLYIQGTSIYLAHFPFLKYGILDTNSVSASIWCRKSLTVFIYTDTVEIQGILGTSWWDLLGSLSWRSALAS